MSSLTHSLVTVVVALECLVVAAAGAQEGASKRTLKSARTAFEAGRVEEARRLYREYLAASAPGNERRDEALFLGAVTTLAADETDADLDAVDSWLDEAATRYPQSEWKPGIDALRQLLGSVQEREVEVTTLRQELAGQRQACVEQQAENDRRLAAAESRIADIEHALDDRSDEAAGLRSQLVEKDEALQAKEAALQLLDRSLAETNQSLDRMLESVKEKNEAIRKREEALQKKEKALRTQQDELEEVRQDLERKDQALEKVKETLTGGGEAKGEEEGSDQGDDGGR